MFCPCSASWYDHVASEPLLCAGQPETGFHDNTVTRFTHLVCSFASILRIVTPDKQCIKQYMPGGMLLGFFARATTSSNDS